MARRRPAMLRFRSTTCWCAMRSRSARIESFGAGLGSNHLGLVADIVLP
jgi:hypothetical protein